MIKIRISITLFVIACYSFCNTSAQSIPLKYGWYKINDGGRVYNSGKCGSYSYTNPVTDFWIKPGMTLHSVEDCFCGGILRDCIKAHGSCGGPCRVTVIDSMHFTYAFAYSYKCISDNTPVYSQGEGTVSLYEEIPSETTEPDPESPPAVSIINKISGFSPEEKEIWSGTAEDTPPVIKICADGSSATRIKFTSCDPEVTPSTVSFRLESDPAGTDPDLYGKLSVDGKSGSDNTVVVVYKHPEYVPHSVAINEYFPGKIVIRYGQKEFEISIRIYRAPVVMVHGLWSDRAAFQKMRKKLVEDRYYPLQLIQLADYSTSNGASFAANSVVVPFNIRVILNICRLAGYSAGKADIIGHSMGGLLTRNYLQSGGYRQDIHKMITINTPHSGSQLANLLTDPSSAVSFAARMAGEPVIVFWKHASIDGGAVADLAVNSNAMNILNFQRLNINKVPGHVITTHTALTKDNFVYLVICAAAPVASMTALSLHNYIFYDQNNDLIVSAPSQTGGLSGTNVTNFTGLIHTSSTDDDRVIVEVEKALCTNPRDAGYFSQSGFAPVPQSSHFKRAEIRMPVQIIPGSLTISNPSRNQSFNPGVSIPVSLNSSNGINRIILEAINLPGNSSVTDTSFSSGIINYKIPPNAFGKLKFVALGYKSDVLTGFDTLTIRINQTSVLDSIAIDGEAVYISQDSIASVTVYAFFKNGYQYDISQLPGVQYQLTDTSRAEYVHLNLIRGKKPGICLLNVSYLNKTKYLPVVVIPKDTLADSPVTSVKEIQNPGMDLSPEENANLEVYPNPFTSSAVIQYRLNQHTRVSLKVLDIYGKQVAELLNAEQSAGEYQSILDGKNLPAGIYIVQLRTNYQTGNRKLLLTKP